MKRETPTLERKSSRHSTANNAPANFVSAVTLKNVPIPEISDEELLAFTLEYERQHDQIHRDNKHHQYTYQKKSTISSKTTTDHIEENQADTPMFIFNLSSLDYDDEEFRAGYPFDLDKLEDQDELPEEKSTQDDLSSTNDDDNDLDQVAALLNSK
ncbi:unnamed protein product [Adineta ricciae]|uniref:Uncharacterized protein n=1 Tax=Adineta ricciae TaxID=249248 RepID=A0A815LPB6_ADIRI|nr:unnamed protein product [Adineta ricciae]